MGDILVGIDLGTTNLTVVAFDVAGEMVAQASRPTPTYHPRAEWTEHDPDRLWERLCEAMREVVSAVGDADRIAGLAIASMGEAGVPLDREGRALYPVIGWHDPRTQPQADRWADSFGDPRTYQITGTPIDYIYSLNKLLWLREHEPDVARRIHKFLCMEDYVIFRLTGELATDLSMASRTMALDMAAEQWSTEIMAAADIDIDIWPPLHESGEIVGRVTAAASAATGLAADTPVVTGGHDHTCGMLAAGVLEPGMMLDSSGTVEGMWFPLAEPLLRDELREAGYAHEHHVVPGLYLISGSVMTSGVLLDWAKETFGFDSIEQMTSAAAAVAPGAGGVAILPHFRGSTTPISDPRSRGAIIGLTMSTNRAAVARAVMEAVAFEMRTNLEFLRRWLPQPLTQIRGIGGGARSDVWLQIKADVLGHPIERPTVTEGTALGAALLAGVGVGVYRDHRAAAGLIPVERTFEPDPDAHARYAEIHDRVYRALYPTLRAVRS